MKYLEHRKIYASGGKIYCFYGKIYLPGGKQNFESQFDLR